MNGATGIAICILAAAPLAKTLDWDQAVAKTFESAKGLQREMELTASEAGAVVAYRTKNGSFANFEALRKAPGIDPSKLERYRESIVS